MATVEKQRGVTNGWAALGVVILTGLILGALGVGIVTKEMFLWAIPWGLATLVWLVCLGGFFTLQPNQAAALVLFGAYTGSVKKEGFKWANPFYLKIKVSQRWHNLNGATIKVNDLRGNPVEIAAVVVWRVADTAKAVFDVDSYDHFMSVQSEAALRHLAMAFPYDSFEEAGTLSLRGTTDEVSLALQREIQERVAKAGVAVEEARLSHLAYAPEIAGAMLQRQQADAVVAARSRIVEGAVGMVEMALVKLEQTGKVPLDEERRAAMVSNLMVVLCGHESAHPIVNAGTLYS